MIPRAKLDLDSITQAKRTSTKISSFRVKHISGRYSTVEFKSYDQGRGAFEGTVRSIWFDEEPPEDIYAECLTRTMTGDNLIMITFTPLEGMSNVIKTFTSGGDYTEGPKGPGKYLINQTWEDIPHLSETVKIELLAAYPEYQRMARSAGIPMLGQGAVYPVPESAYTIDPLNYPIPSHWKRVAGLDFGFVAPTAIVWAAIDTENEIYYIYAEHYFKEKTPLFHCEAIKTRNNSAGFDIPIVCDPSGGGTSMSDGLQTRLIYEQHGIQMISATNSIEPGITKVLEMFIAGKIKIFSSCVNLLSELRVYQRDKKGNPAGSDHACDALRYLIMSGFENAKTKAEFDASKNFHTEYIETWNERDIHPDSWMYR